MRLSSKCIITNDGKQLFTAKYIASLPIISAIMTPEHTTKQSYFVYFRGTMQRLQDSTY